MNTFAAACALLAALCAPAPASAVEMAGPEENWANFCGAVHRDRPDVVKEMLEKGFPVNVHCQDSDPALVRAIRMDNKRVVDVLLAARGIDVDMASDYGETALMLAAFKGDIELAKRLHAMGARIDGTQSWTPLHYAATNGHDKMVEWLLANKAQVNLQTGAGVTALYMAARKPSRKVVQQLLKAGAYRDLCNDKGQSPADAALRAGDEELAKYLAVDKCVQPSARMQPLPKP
ncbi:MAG: ankyrin repeat domain-containing protein [Duodenibacillus sp.]|nr:ankyrin repeat domain-containing protein [Duodenibacillus sp.]